MTAEHPDWLIVKCGEAPPVVSIPHAGVDLAGFEPAFVDPWLARKDADLRLDELYDFLEPLGATVVRTSLSRSVIDVNRDPGGASPYPGQATTELWPTMTFDGEPLYRSGRTPDTGETAERRRLYFDPYHAALGDEIARLRQTFKRVALFDAHSIRSRIPRLFDGQLPVFNLGTNSGASCDPELRRTVGAVLAAVNEARSLTSGSRAAGSRAPMASRARASRPCSWNWAVEPICRSRSNRRPTTGRRRSTKSAPPQRARRSTAFWRRSLPGSPAENRERCEEEASPHERAFPIREYARHSGASWDRAQREELAY